jgi:hypothetical protein
MRRFFAAAAGSAAALVGFAGAAQPSATIDLIWDDTGTNEIDDSGDQEIQLNVILTAGPGGSDGAGVSVDFSSFGEHAAAALVQKFNGSVPVTPRNTPSRAPDPLLLPIELEYPLIRIPRVELINSVCICDLDLGIGLEAGQSHRLGFVTFNISLIPVGRYEIRSDANGASDGVLDGDGNGFPPETEITFNSAFIDSRFPPITRNPRSKRKRYR